jgi:hypothetical protein
MAYSASNPPHLIAGRIGGTGIRLWGYRSTDAETAFDDTDYVTNADDLGMATGDFVFIVDTTNSLSTLAQVTVDADGNGTFSPLTAIT